MFAGVRLQFGPIDSHMPELDQARLVAQPQSLREQTPPSSGDASAESWRSNRDRGVGPPPGTGTLRLHRSLVRFSANSPLPGSSRTATPAPSSPGGRPPFLVHPYVRRPLRSWTSPVRWLSRRGTAPDDPPAASPATTAGEGTLGSGRRCGSACSHYQRTRLRNISIRKCSGLPSPGPPCRIYLRQTPSGARIPLSRVAEVKVASGASVISRSENQRTISVRTNIRGRDQGSFVAEAQRRVRAEVRLPRGYKVDWGGQFENLSRARRRLAWSLPITLLLIFPLLFWTFGSLRKAALVLVSVPLSIVGGVAALYVRGIPFSVSAAVGFVSLFGVAVMSGVLFVTEIHRQRTELDRPLREAVMVGASNQF